MKKLTMRGFVVAMAALSAISACGGNQPDPGVNPDMPTTVKVENQAGDDFTIYVWRSGQRLRLGTVSMGQTQTFKLAKSVVVGMTTLRFEADPIGRRRSAISEELTINPGEELVLRLGPI